MLYGQTVYWGLKSLWVMYNCHMKYIVSLMLISLGSGTESLPVDNDDWTNRKPTLLSTVDNTLFPFNTISLDVFGYRCRQREQNNVKFTDHQTSLKCTCRDTTIQDAAYSQIKIVFLFKTLCSSNIWTDVNLFFTFLHENNIVCVINVWDTYLSTQRVASADEIHICTYLIWESLFTHKGESFIKFDDRFLTLNPQVNGCNISECLLPPAVLSDLW